MRHDPHTQQAGIGGGAPVDTEPRHAPGDDTAGKVIGPGMRDRHWWKRPAWENPEWGRTRKRPRYVPTNGHVITLITGLLLAVGIWQAQPYWDADYWIYYDEYGNERSQAEVMARTCLLPDDPCDFRREAFDQEASSSDDHPEAIWGIPFTPGFIAELERLEAEDPSDQGRIECILARIEVGETFDDEEEEVEPQGNATRIFAIQSTEGGNAGGDLGGDSDPDELFEDEPIIELP